MSAPSRISPVGQLALPASGSNRREFLQRFGLGLGSLALADAYAKRDGDLKSLQQGALPAAEAQVRLRERDVTIANHYGWSLILRGDLEKAREVLIESLRWNDWNNWMARHYLEMVESALKARSTGSQPGQ